MKRPYSNSEKNQAGKQFSVKRKNDRRHRLQCFLTNTVANTKQDVNGNGRDVHKPFGWDFYKVAVPICALLFSVRVSWVDSITLCNCVLLSQSELQE